MRRFLPTLSIIFILCSSVYALETQLQTQLKDDKKILHEEELARELNKPKITDIAPVENKYKLVKEMENCTNFRKVIILNSTLISEEFMNNLNKKYLLYCVTPDLLNSLILDINQTKYFNMSATAAKKLHYPDELSDEKNTVYYLMAGTSVRF